MQIFELQGELRTDLGKKATNLLRAEGKVPCVLYGGKENVHFCKNCFTLRLYTS